MKNLFFFILVFTMYSLHAQDGYQCWLAKHDQQQYITPKTRAGVYPNQLMSRYDMHFYFLDLHVERNTTVIDGAVTLGAKLVSSSDTFCFELNQNLIIDSIVYNNQAISYNRFGNITYALFGSTVASGSNVFVKVYYHGDAYVPGAAAVGNGFTHNNSNVWGDTAVFSLSQPYSAYEWFPCKQFLQDKADSAWIFITTSNQNLAGSNGLLEGVDTLSATNQLRFRWKTHYKIDYYLISVAVGKYLDYTFYAHPASLPNDSVKIVNYLYRTNPATYTTIKPVLDSVALMLEYYSDLFGLYPFYQEKYGHCMTPFGGGMEHQTMTSTEYAGSFILLSHELMHHWFGDYVTCQSWKDIFLNEGFASYGEYLCIQHFRGQSFANTKMNTVQNIAMSDTVGSIYFTDTTDVARIFSWEYTYNKGSAVLHTLRFILGDSTFFSAMRDYLITFGFGTANLTDFHISLESSTGAFLNHYFNQWIYGEGYPVYSGQYYSDGDHIFLNVKHRTSASSTPLFHTPLEVKCFSPSGDTIVRVNINSNSDTFKFPSQKIITGLDFDPNNWLMNKVDSVTQNTDLQYVGINETIDDSYIQIVPNPVQNQVMFYSTETSGTKAEILDATGHMIRSIEFNLRTSLPVYFLPRGIYYVRFTSDRGVVVKRFVKE